MSIQVLKPGLLTTIQDRGRVGYQKFGIIVSGAMDPFAFRVANLLVGNDEGAAALEITAVGPELYFEQDACIAICGGDLSPTIDGYPVPLWRMVRVRERGKLRFGAPISGCRSYLAVAGGVDIAPELGSRSTYLRAGLGGYEGRSLRAGDVLSVGLETALTKHMKAGLTNTNDQSSPLTAAALAVSSQLLPAYSDTPIIRVMKGREFELFDKESRKVLFSEGFKVLPQSDRMGYRLSGPALHLSAPQEMISEAVTFGTIQVPSDGNPIVLMADRQTTGGYPKIAQVISADLPLMAQLNLGAQIHFREVTLEEAQALRFIREMEIRLLKQGIRMRYGN